MYPLISSAHAQAASAAGAGDGGLASSPVLQFAPLILIFVVFYFLMIRPQQQQQKELKTKLSAVRKGDRVLTAGGIVGVVQRAREGAAEIEVEIAPNVRVTVMRDTLSSVLTASAPAPANDSK